MPEFRKNSVAVILGASGGIGAAMIDQLVYSNRFSKIYALSVRPYNQSRSSTSTVVPVKLDDYSESSIETSLNKIKAQTQEINFALAATGLLHQGSMTPEKSLSRLNETALLALFTANSITPIIFAKHIAGYMSKTHPAVLAAISARVGSISDNRLGGWYSYRASKAALNMLYCNLAIEMKRLNPNLIVTLLHPGTTNTRLSKPFQANLKSGQLFSPSLSAKYMYTVIQELDQSNSGQFFAWDGQSIEW